MSSLKLFAQCAAACLLAACAAASAWGHSFAPARLSIQESEAAEQYQTLWRAPVNQIPGVRLAPRLPANCEPVGEPRRTSVGSGLQISWPVRCPGGLVGRTVAVDGLAGARSAALLEIGLRDGRSWQRLLSGEQPEFTVPERTGNWRLAGDYALLGARHILGGFDHLMFLAGLLLLARGRSLVWVVTAFTLGHSATLALAALGLIRYPVAWLELAIAISVLAVAVEASRHAGPGDRRAGWLTRNVGVSALAFGLLHGMGFAGALSEIGMPAGQVPLALLSFNVGVEIGQLLFILPLAWAIALVRLPQRMASRARTTSVYAVGALAAMWCFERTLIALG